MKLSKTIRKHIGILVSGVFVMLIALSSCEMGIEPQEIVNESEQTATLTITVPRVAPWIADKFETENMTAKAWIYADQVAFGLFDADWNLVDRYDVLTWQYQPETGLPSSQVTDWEIPAGTYYLYCYIWNEYSQLYIDTGGDSSVWGIYPEQPNRDVPTQMFTVSGGESLSVTITNFPTAPTDIPQDVWPATATYYEGVYGEKWFAFTTGPSDAFLYVDVTSYSTDGITNPDAGLFLFGPDGVFLAKKDFYAGDYPTALEELEYIRSDEAGFTVLPNSTYYVGVYAWGDIDFEMYRYTAPTAP